MSLRDKIRPINGKHSIREAVISLFLANPILKPSRFEKLIQAEYAHVFQKFGVVSQLQVQFQRNDDGRDATNITNQAEAGFKFSAFESGKPKRVLQGINEAGRTFVSYHELGYERWALFYSDYKDQVRALGNIQADIFINAFSLHYIDEFLWIDKEGGIDLSLFFKKNQKLPLDFFDSINPIFSLVAEKEINGVVYYDRLEIQVRSDIQPSVVISHNVTEALQKEVQLSDLFRTDFESKLADMHEYNKKLLKDLLTEEIQQLIELV
ncbi:TIGR04255 family protein [Olivibacter sitiensis]|uniref:TIGR04255 family protein n=1 Tax=Olivibacter sitiensis TaxID=376470 RepID=UPI0004288376|nr:TIGR04255 family protein [Olivibacter sitiensis]